MPSSWRSTPPWPLAVIDFEASSLDDDSYPVEIGLALWPGPDEPIFGWSTLVRLNRWHYRQGGDAPPDLFDLAAAYGFGLIKNHVLRDGNKRIGAAACLLFLRANGREIASRPAQLVTVFVALARGRFRRRRSRAG